jgi:hypothetical protein
VRLWEVKLSNTFVNNGSGSSYLGEFVLCFAQNDGLADSGFTKDLPLRPTNLDLRTSQC